METRAIDQAFAALADPTRVEIVARLSRGPASVTELARPFAMSLRGVLKHVEVLEDAGLVHTLKTGRVRRCELRPDRMDDISRWIDHQRRVWDRRLDRLDEYLRDEERP